MTKMDYLVDIIFAAGVGAIVGMIGNDYFGTRESFGRAVAFGSVAGANLYALCKYAAKSAVRECVAELEEKKRYANRERIDGD